LGGKQLKPGGGRIRKKKGDLQRFLKGKRIPASSRKKKKGDYAKESNPSKERGKEGEGGTLLGKKEEAFRFSKGQNLTLLRGGRGKKTPFNTKKGGSERRALSPEAYEKEGEKQPSLRETCRKGRKGGCLAL